MFDRKNPKAIRFEGPNDVPPHSVGYFSTEKEPIEAMKDEHDIWYLVTIKEGNALPAKRFQPKNHWIFTANSGPANDEALKDLVRDELVQEAVGFTDEQANVVLGALRDKLGETEHYLLSYREAAGEPGPLDSCCEAHLARFEERKRQRRSLVERQKSIERLIQVFGRYAHSFGNSATKPSSAQENARLREALHAAREAWWKGAEQGDAGIAYTDDVERAMDGIWDALQVEDEPLPVEQDELEAIADQILWDEENSARITEKQLVELLRQAARAGGTPWQGS